MLLHLEQKTTYFLNHDRGYRPSKAHLPLVERVAFHKAQICSVGVIDVLGHEGTLGQGTAGVDASIISEKVAGIGGEIRSSFGTGSSVITRPPGFNAAFILFNNRTFAAWSKWCSKFVNRITSPTCVPSIDSLQTISVTICCRLRSSSMRAMRWQAEGPSVKPNSTSCQISSRHKLNLR